MNLSTKQERYIGSLTLAVLNHISVFQQVKVKVKRMLAVMACSYIATGAIGRPSKPYVSIFARRSRGKNRYVWCSDFDHRRLSRRRRLVVHEKVAAARAAENRNFGRTWRLCGTPSGHRTRQYTCNQKNVRGCCTVLKFQWCAIQTWIFLMLERPYWRLHPLEHSYM